MLNQIDDTQPNALWSKIQGCLDELGITRVNDVTGLDEIGIPVWQAVRPSSRTLSVSQGKGLSQSYARASAVMEAVEMSVLEMPLEAESVVDHEYNFHSPVRPSFAYRHAYENRPPSVLIPSVSIPSLTSKKALFWPAEAVRLDFTVLEMNEDFPIYSTSNGVGSSDSRDNAVTHALQELVERHVLYSLRYNQRTRMMRRVRMGLSPNLDNLISKLDACRISTYGALVGQFAGLQVAEARIQAPDGGPVYSGSAARKSLLRALEAALLEAIQSRLTAIAGSRDDVKPQDLFRFDHAPRDRTCPTEEFAFEQFRDDSDAGRMDEILEGLGRVGIEAYVWDFNTKLPVHVVRVVAPELMFNTRDTA